MKAPTFDVNYLFDVRTVSRSDIIDLMKKWSKSEGRYVHSLLMQINQLKGFAPITLVDLDPNRNHGWELKFFDRSADYDADSAVDFEGRFERVMAIGAWNTAHGFKYVTCHYYGQPPSSEQIIKKLKEHGVRQ